MIAYPAIDLRQGHVVQLVGGRPDQERVRLDHPVDVALHWVRAGFRALHVVDLDAALGLGDNLTAIHELIRSAGVPVQVGGGVREAVAVDELLEAGAARVIVGTRAIQDPDWLVRVAADRPGRIMLAADVRDGAVLTHGWTESAPVEILALLGRLDAIPLAAVLVTDVAREGRVEGADASRFHDLVRATGHALVAAGGIAGLSDLRALQAAGVAGAVLGMALYTGVLDGAAAAREFDR